MQVHLQNRWEKVECHCQFIIGSRSRLQKQLEKVAIIAMYCHLRPTDAIAFQT